MKKFIRYCQFCKMPDVRDQESKVITCYDCKTLFYNNKMVRTKYNFERIMSKGNEYDISLREVYEKISEYKCGKHIKILRLLEQKLDISALS